METRALRNLELNERNDIYHTRDLHSPNSRRKAITE